MKCDKCEKEATIEMVITDEGEVTNVNLCIDCYQNMMDEKGMDIDQGTGDIFGDILSALLSFSTVEEEEFEPRDGDYIKCLKCGQSAGDLRRTAVFGCENCYKIHKELALELLQKIQGSNKYVGLHPQSYDQFIDIQSQINRENQLLEELVEEERYEEAAKVKRGIDRLKTSLEEMEADIDD